MQEIVGVKFKKIGKIYFFDADNIKLKKGDGVIVETARGIEYGEVAIENRNVEEEKIVAPLKNVLRIATEEDKKTYSFYMYYDENTGFIYKIEILKNS